MKYDISTAILTHTGEPVKATRETDADGNLIGPDMTVKDILELACINPPQDEQSDGEKKHQIYRLLQKIHAADDVIELTSEEVTKLKRYVGGVSNVIVTGFVFDFLENPISEPQNSDEDEG